MIGKIIALIVLSTVIALAGGAFLMLLAGSFGHHWPYWQSVWRFWLLNVLATFLLTDWSEP